MTTTFMMLAEYQVLWNLRRASLTPGTLRLFKLPHMNLHMFDSLFDIYKRRFQKCHPSFYNAIPNSESTALTSFSVESSLNLGEMKNYASLSKPPSKASLEHSK
jgi:hypothetical protein